MTTWTRRIAHLAVTCALAATGVGLTFGTAYADGVTIDQIQGIGASSPLVNETVTTQGVVTAAYPTGNFKGFIIQRPGSGGPTDTTPSASDAIFVYTGSLAITVAIGDSVSVTGKVSEYQGLTELAPSTPNDVTPTAEPLEPVQPVTGAWPATDPEREALEGMLFLPVGTYTVSDTYTTAQYGEVVLAYGDTPLMQPTEIAAPGSADAEQVAADNASRKVVMDDGSSVNFLNQTDQTPPYVSTTDPTRVGEKATFTSPVIVDYRNNTWKFNPTDQYTAGEMNAPVTFSGDRPAAPDTTAIGKTSFKVASFNVLNYFTTLGSQTPGCVPYKDKDGDPVTVKEGCDPRGAWDPDDFDRQQQKIVKAINKLDASVVGLSEIENSARLGEPVDEALSTLVNALNADAGTTKWAFVPSNTAQLPPTDQQDVITNALIYQPAQVTSQGDAQVLGDQSAPGMAFQNARTPIGVSVAPADGSAPVFVAINHFKSKGSAGPWPGDADSGDGQGYSTESRVRQANALEAWAAPTAASVGAQSIALIGDFNSYSQEDPLQALYSAGYANVQDTLGMGKYSYVFGSLSGSLDHILVNGDLATRLSGGDIWNINSGESVALEYSRYNNYGSLFYADGPYRSSDHDPVVIGIKADVSATPVATIDAPVVHRGEQLTVTGEQFPPNMSVTVTLGADVLGTMMTENSGNATGSFTLPVEGKKGKQSVTLTAANGAAASTAIAVGGYRGKK